MKNFKIPIWKRVKLHIIFQKSLDGAQAKDFADQWCSEEWGQEDLASWAEEKRREVPEKSKSMIKGTEEETAWCIPTFVRAWCCENTTWKVGKEVKLGWQAMTRWLNLLYTLLKDLYFILWVVRSHWRIWRSDTTHEVLGMQDRLANLGVGSRSLGDYYYNEVESWEYLNYGSGTRNSCTWIH